MLYAVTPPLTIVYRLVHYSMSNRETILACALQLFSARGYDAVGVQEIVEAVGIQKPTLYHYFGSKAGLLHSLLARFCPTFR